VVKAFSVLKLWRTCTTGWAVQIMCGLVDFSTGLDLSALRWPFRRCFVRFCAWVWCVLARV